MAETLFDRVAADLQERTTLDKLEARGTLRLALKDAGLDAKNVTVEQMRVVLEKVMPGELETRGVDSAEEVCTAVVAALERLGGSDSTTTDSPEAVFARLGSS